MPARCNQFLAVAYAEQKISHAQAWEIEDERRTFVTARMSPPKTGEIATVLGILPKHDVQWILVKQKEHKGNGRVFDDPLSTPSKKRAGLKQSVRARVVAGMVVLVCLLVTWIISQGSWNDVGITGVLGTVWLAVDAISPVGAPRKLSWHRLISELPTILIPICFGYVLFVAASLRAAEASVPQDPLVNSHLWRRLLSAVYLLGTLSLVTLISGRWRHYEIWLLRFRVDLMRNLAATVQQGVADCHSDQSRAQADVWHHSRLLLEGTARVLSLNPFERLLNGLLHVARIGSGGTSLWYLEPHGDTFATRLHVEPGASDEVHKAFDRVAAAHRPVKLNAQRLQVARDSVTKDGIIDRDGFLRIPDRHQYISLTGWVFARKQTVDSGNLDECLVFDKTCKGGAHVHGLTKDDQRWLDFRSVAAYPVFRVDDPEGEPAGVLIAFKCIRNGITAEDKSALAMTARLLSVLFHVSSTGLKS